MRRNSRIIAIILVIVLTLSLLYTPNYYVAKAEVGNDQVQSPTDATMASPGDATMGDETQEGLTSYENGFVIENGVLLEYTGTDVNIVIPEGVTEIGEKVFENRTDILSVKLPEGLQVIGEYSFYGCTSLTGTLIIPATVEKIEYSAFRDCISLKGDLVLPKELSAIGGYAFSGCEGLDGELIFYDNQALEPRGALVSIGDGAFWGCENLIGDLIIPESVIEIGENAFYGCSGFTGELHISKSVTEIKHATFYGCGFTGTLYIPDGVTVIGDSAFSWCRNIDGTLTIPGSVISIGNHAFSVTSIDFVQFGNKVTSIGKEAFYCCNNITELYFTGQIAPNILDENFDETTANVDANIEYFLSCMLNLETITVPEGCYASYNERFGEFLIDWEDARITELGAEDFVIRDGVLMEYLGSDTSVIIPEGVVEVSSFAFVENETIEEIVFPSTLKIIDSYAFAYCTSLAGELKLPDGLEIIGECAFDGRDGLTGNLILPETLTTIGNGAFINCTGFTGSLTIPDSVTTIGSEAFKGCTGMEGQLNISNNVARIEWATFMDCKFTGELVIPDSVTFIDQVAFSDCAGIEAIVFGENVSSINEYAFDCCYGVTEIVYTGNASPRYFYYDDNNNLVYYEEGWLFFGSFECLETVIIPVEGCGTYMSMSGWHISPYLVIEGYEDCKDFVIVDNKLVAYRGNDKEVVIPENVTEIGESAFLANGLEKVVFPEGLVSIGDSAFEGCWALSGKLIFPDSLQYIGDSAFEYCDLLIGDLLIPDNVESIGDFAFYHCNKMQGKLQLPKGIKSIGRYAFSGCGFTGNLMLPEGLENIGDGAFCHCNGVKGDLYIPDTVTSIGGFAFGWCSGLNGELRLSESLTVIEDRCFEKCNFKGELVIPDGVIKIDSTAFMENEFQGKVIIPDSVYHINYGVFRDCDNITSIVFGRGVEYLYESIFPCCDGITEVTFLGKKPRLVLNQENVEGTTGSDSYSQSLFDKSIAPKINSIYVNPAYIDEYSSAWGPYLDPSITLTSYSGTEPVTNLKTEYVYSKSAKISWLPPVNSDVTAYNIYRDGQLVATVTDTYYVDQELVLGEEYVYEIVGYTTVGIETTPVSITVNTDKSSVLDIFTSNPVYQLSVMDGRLYTTIKRVDDVKNDAGESLTVDFYYYDTEGNKIKIGETIDDYSLKSDGEITYETDWDVTNVPEGEYKVEVDIIDPDGTVVVYDKTLTVDNSVPEAISKIVAIGDVNKIVLSWTMSHEIDTNQYVIYRRTETEEEYSVVKRIYDRSTLTYTDTTATENIKYYYYIVGVNDANQPGEMSEITCATPGTDMELPRVVKLTPNNNSKVSGTVSFYTQAQDNIQVTSTELYYSVDEGVTWELFSSQNSDYCRGSVDTTLLDATTLQIKALSYDAAGNVSTGLTYSYTIDNVGPEKVSGLSYESTSTTLTLKWNDVADQDLSYFRVEEKVDGEFVKIKDVSTTLGTNIFNKKPETSYVYRIVAYDTMGNRGIESDEINVMTGADVTIPVVTSIKPGANYYNKSIAVSITAEDDDSISEIKVQISKNGVNWEDYSTKTFSGNNRKETVYLTLDVSAWEDGYCYVRGIPKDASGNEGDSTSTAPYVQYIVDHTAPVAPTGLADNSTAGLIEISWDMAKESDINGYNVYRSTDGETYSILKSGVYNINYIDRNVQADVTYYYKIAARDKAGNISEMSEPISATMTNDTEVPTIVSYGPTNGTLIGPSKQTFQILAQDNWKLSSIKVMYAINGSNNYTELINQTNINNYYKTVSANLPVAKCQDGDTIQVNVVVTDIQGLETTVNDIMYVVDKEAPKVGLISAIGDNEKISVSWNGYGESDLAGYKLYRKTANGTYSLIAQRAATSSLDYNFVDYNITNDETYYYKVEAYDKTGNYTSMVSESSWVIIEPIVIADFETELFQEVSVEYAFDASKSVADMEIESYEFDFGDGTIVSSKDNRVVHKYATTGQYQVKLVVTDTTGEKDEYIKIVTVDEPRLIGSVKIKVVDSNGNKITGMPVYFDLDNTSENVKYSGTDGCVTFNGSAGQYAIGVYGDGYLPVKRYIAIAAGTTQEISITMVYEPIVTGEFEVTRMTLDEIVNAGISISDPDNQHVVKVDISISYGKEKVDMSFKTNGKENLGDSGTTIVNSGDGNRALSIGWFSLNTDLSDVSLSSKKDLGVIAIIDVPVEASYLKEFFDVKLHIINHADSEFVLTDNVVTLNVPDGMTVMKTNKNSETATVSFDELQGQEQRTVSWILRGDVEGEYNLSADYSAVLSQFNCAVETTFRTDTPITVYGKNAMKLIADINYDVMYGAVYFDLSLKNIGGADMYNPTINIIDDVVTVYEEDMKAGEEKEVSVLNTLVSNGQGYTQYLGKEGTITTLASGDMYTKKYVVYGAIDDNDRLMLIDAVQKSAEVAGIEVEIRTVDMDLYDRRNAEEKVESIFSDPDKCDMYYYLVDKDNNQFYYQILDMQNDEHVAEEIGYRVTNIFLKLDFELFTHDEVEEITRNYICELLQDETFQTAVDERIDTTYINIAKNLLSSATIINSCESEDMLEFLDNLSKDQKKLSKLGEALEVEDIDLFNGLINEYWLNYASSWGIQYINFYLSRDEVLTEFSGEMKGYFKYYNKMIDSYSALIDSYNVSAKMYYEFVYLESVRAEANELFDIILAHDEINDVVYDEVKSLKDKINNGFDSQGEIFVKELADRFAIGVLGDAKPVIVKFFNKAFLGAESGKLFTAANIIFTIFKVVYGVLDYTLGWGVHFNNVNKLRVASELTKALQNHTIALRSSKGREEEFLISLKYLIKMRILGEKVFVEVVRAEDDRNKLYPDDYDPMELQYLQDINDWEGERFLGCIVTSLDSWYILKRNMIVQYRDALFGESYSVYGLPEAPKVTLNYQTLTTNELFDESYEYSYDGVNWTTCDGKAISFTQGNVGYYIWVRLKATSENFAGDVTKVYVQSATFSGEKLDERLVGYSLSLKGNIGVNFYLDIDEETAKNVSTYMLFTMPDGKESKVYIGDARKGELNNIECYIFTCEVPAAEMNEGITGVLVSGDKIGDSYEYAVKTYGDYIIENPNQQEAFDDVEPLVKSMLVYGGYSQEYFDKSTDKLASEGIENDIENSQIDVDSIEDFEVPRTNIGIKYYASSLLLKSETSIRHYFTVQQEDKTLDEIKEEYTFEFDGQVVEPMMKDGRIYIQKDNIAAAELDTYYEVIVTNNNTGKSIQFSYSALNYVEAVIEMQHANTKLINLVKAMYFYNLEADKYF